MRAFDIVSVRRASLMLRLRLVAGLFILCASWLAGGAPALAAGGPYLLNPGDVLQISVWKESTLDREVLVLPDGSIGFPLVGELPAAGRTVTDLQQEITRKIAPYIPDAAVTVMVKAALGNEVSVIGQVAKPGEIVMTHRATVMQALSMAGGLTPYADHKAILVLRRENGKETAIPFPYDEVIRGKSLQDDIMLQPGDVIVVPTAKLF